MKGKRKKKEAKAETLGFWETGFVIALLSGIVFLGYKAGWIVGGILISLFGRA